MKYRIGRKQKRAILTEDGYEVVVFAKGKEDMAELVCRLLNEHSTNTPVIKSVCNHFDEKENKQYRGGYCPKCNDIIK